MKTIQAPKMLLNIRKKQALNLFDTGHFKRIAPHRRRHPAAEQMQWHVLEHTHEQIRFEKDTSQTELEVDCDGQVKFSDTVKDRLKLLGERDHVCFLLFRQCLFSGVIGQDKSVPGGQFVVKFASGDGPFEDASTGFVRLAELDFNDLFGQES